LRAALAAGIATSAVAQSNVYSLNVVGYYNIPLAANQKVMLGNQLNTTNNTLAGIIPNPPGLAQFLQGVNGGFTTYQFDDWVRDGCLMAMFHWLLAKAVSSLAQSIQR